MNVGLIPAKGHSTRVPGKNIRLFHGKPIIAYTIETAFDAGIFDKVFVSTDSKKVSQIAEEYGADVIMRPDGLTVDTIGPVDIARYHLNAGELGKPDYICLLYATAPFMRAEDIRRGRRVARRRNTDFVVSVGVEPFHDAAQFLWCKAARLRRGAVEFDTTTALVKVPVSIDINSEDDW